MGTVPGAVKQNIRFVKLPLMPKVSDEHRVAQRDRIQHAAIAVARRKGVQAATMAEIIAESGLSAGAIYGYYASKDDLILDLAQTVLGSRIGIAEGLLSLPEVPPPALAMQVLMRDLPEDWLAGGLMLQFWGVAAADDRMREAALELGHTMIMVMERYLTAWYHHGGADVDQAAAMAGKATPAMLALAQGYIMQRSIGLLTDFTPYGEAIEQLVGNAPR